MSQLRNPFTRTGALGLNHSLFRGRAVELERLERACLSEHDFFLLVYGGRQNGKTSVLLRLEANLRAQSADGVRVCRVDFQGLPRASSSQAYYHLARSVAAILPHAPQPPTAPDAPALIDFFEQTLYADTVTRLVLLLDELGTLPEPTREDLAHVLRSLHTRRLGSAALAKVQIVLAGGIELYNLAVVEASALRNVCEIVRLADLSAADAIALITDGLVMTGIEELQATTLGQAIYTCVHGHPYLTQRLGSMLAEQQLAGEMPDVAAVDARCWSLIEGDNPLLDHLRRSINELQLLDAARHLLAGSQRASRTDDAVARLELLGVAQRVQGRWLPRSPLLTVALAEWIGIYLPEGVSLVEGAEHARQHAIAEHLGDLKREHDVTTQRAPQAATVAEQVRLQRRVSELTNEIQRLEAAQQARPTPTITPAPAPTVITEPAQQVMPPEARPVARPLWVPELVRVPAGPFLMGSSNADTLAHADEKPQHQLELPDYWIGKTSVTNAQFRPFVEGDGYRNQAYWMQTGWEWREDKKVAEPRYWEDSEWNNENHPVVGVSWFEAVAYCHWLQAQTGQKFRLPSEAEWEKAARGPNGFIWPWGNQWQDERCNSKELNLSRTTPVDRYPNGASPYGALDMAGNVWEWCATQSQEPYPYQLEEEWQHTYLNEDSRRVLRGGSWYSDQKGVRGAYRGNRYPRARGNNIGLRVASHSLRTDPVF